MAVAKNIDTSKVSAKLAHFAGSQLFFVLSLILFFGGAIWEAVFSLFPGAFDEDTHLGIIKYFARHPNPFFSHQPTMLDQYGAVVHDSSYLYRYLMSFPWRLVSAVSTNLTTQIITMRLINIALLGMGVILLRQLLMRLGAGRIAANPATFLFVMTPITLQLASQINYDNMLIPLMAIVFILSVDIAKQLNPLKLDVRKLSILLSLGFLTCLVKYTFVPLFLGLLLYLGWLIIKAVRNARTQFMQNIIKSYKSVSHYQKVFLIVLLFFSFGLFFERYGLNTLRYRTPLPSCVQVIGPGRCEANSIYRRDIIYNQAKPAVINKNPIRFSYLWLKHMEFNIAMVINGPASGYSIGLPLPLLNIALIVFSTAGALLCLVFYRHVFDGEAIRAVMIALWVYLALLWITNYSGYLQTGRRVAVQGRYLVPFLPIFYFLFLKGFSRLLESRTGIKTAAASLLVICFFTSGGFVTYVLHSDNSWYWQNNHMAISSNRYAKSIFKYVIPGANQKSPYFQSSLDF